jgi:hypothetical protein
MAPKPGMLAFVFGLVLAMLSIRTWAGPANPESESAAPSPPKETIYRPDYWTVY